MLILGRNPDDTGTQLERLSQDILVQQGYRNIIRSRISAGGEEIDLSADFSMPIPGGARELRVIVECKAYRNPVAMTDWLKFLGKVFVEEVNLNEEVSGLFIALSGVNGNVAGSYDDIRHRRTRIRLLSGDELAEIVCTLYGAQSAVVIAAKLARLTPRRHLGIELIYYQQQVDWLISFGNQGYTLLTSTGLPPVPDRLNLIRPLIEQRTANTVFIDLQEEAHARQRAHQLQQSVMVALIGAPAPLTETALAQLHENFELSEVAEAKQILRERGWIFECEEGVVPVASATPNFYTTLAEILRFIFNGEVTAETIERVMMSDYLRSVINHEMVDHIIQTQRGVPIPEDDKAMLLQVVSMSPRALLYALTPDPMIVNHREAISGPQQFDSFDTEVLMKSIFDGLDEDFRTAALSRYFHALHAVQEVETLRTVIVKGVDAVLCRRELRNRLAVGPLAERHGGGYIYINVPLDAPQPWELGPPSQVDVFPPTT